MWYPPATLAAGDSIDILLEFFFPTRVPATGLTYTAIGVPAVSTTENPGNGTPVTLTNWWTG